MRHLAQLGSFSSSAISWTSVELRQRLLVGAVALDDRVSDGQLGERLATRRMRLDRRTRDELGIGELRVSSSCARPPTGRGVQ